MQRVIFPACTAVIRRGVVVAMGEKRTVLTIGVRGASASAKVVATADSINPKECFIPREDVEKRVLSTMGRLRQLEAYIQDGDIKPDTNLSALRLDELDMQEIREAIGGTFAVDISEDIAKRWNTPKKFIDHIVYHPQAK